MGCREWFYTVVFTTCSGWQPLGFRRYETLAVDAWWLCSQRLDRVPQRRDSPNVVREENNSKEMWSFTSNGNIKATFGNCHHYLKLSDEDKPEFYVFERILLNGCVARGQCHTRGVLATLTPRPPSYAPSSALQVRNLHTISFFVCFVFLNCYNYYFVAVLS